MVLTKRKPYLKYLFLFAAIGISIAIFLFSAQSGTASLQISDGFTVSALQFFPNMKGNNAETLLQIAKSLAFIVRKTAHFAIYLALGITVFGTVYQFTQTKKKSIVATMGYCFFYAITDEIHQYFVPGRSARVFDVCVDATGALTGVCICLFVLFLLQKHADKKNKKTV